MASCRWCCAAQVADGLTHNPLQNDLPGPGNYHRATSFIRTADSVSKLGYGVGFVSKVRSAACGARLAARRLTATPSALPQSKRFAAQDRSHMQSTLDPGPGAYNADPLRLRKANFSRAKTTGVFAKPRRVRRPATCRDRCALACLPHRAACRSTETTHTLTCNRRPVPATTTPRFARSRRRRPCSSRKGGRAPRSSPRPSATRTSLVPASRLRQGTTSTTPLHSHAPAAVGVAVPCSGRQSRSSASCTRRRRAEYPGLAPT